MRVAVVSDIHGNRTAFEAVLADLRETSPDLILHGGDVSDMGSSPVEIIDQIRDLGWQGVVGNTDEMLFRPASLASFASESPKLKQLFDAVEETAQWTREALGSERLNWLKGLPRTQAQVPFTLVHASPESPWRAPADTEFESVFGPLGQAIVVYGHIHRPFVRRMPGMTIVNSGSVGLPYDGDRRASYVLLDDSAPQIRRVEYDVGKEVRALSASQLPHSDWIARLLETSTPQMP